MQRERVTESIYVFTSDLYAQVTAGAVVTPQGAILIDTLLYPEETHQLKHYIQDRLRAPIRFVINTHHHADHTLGTCQMVGAQVVAHRKCYDLLKTRGRESLERMKANSTAQEWRDVEVVLPDVTFDDRLTLSFGGKTLHLWHTPGHSADSIVCYVEEEQVLFGADTVMPIPYFVDGSPKAFLRSLESLQGRAYEAIIQGHGEVVLRGEVEDKLDEDIAYLRKVQAAVDHVLATVPAQRQARALEAIRLEACGKSHVLLNGAAGQLHQNNVQALAQRRQTQAQPATNPAPPDNG